MSVENGSERLGVPPALVTDYLALVGDTSDNVPGVKGIGEKTAQELVNSYGIVENILAHAAGGHGLKSGLRRDDHDVEIRRRALHRERADHVIARCPV